MPRELEETLPPHEAAFVIDGDGLPPRQVSRLAIRSTFRGVRLGFGPFAQECGDEMESVGLFGC